MNKGNVKFLTKRAEMLQSIISDFEIKRDDLQEAYDSSSEKWQESEKGEILLEEISNLEDSINNLEAALTYLEPMVDYE